MPPARPSFSAATAHAVDLALPDPSSLLRLPRALASRVSRNPFPLTQHPVARSECHIPSARGLESRRESIHDVARGHADTTGAKTDAV